MYTQFPWKAIREIREITQPSTVFSFHFLLHSLFSCCFFFYDCHRPRYFNYKQNTIIILSINLSIFYFFICFMLDSFHIYQCSFPYSGVLKDGRYLRGPVAIHRNNSVNGERVAFFSHADTIPRSARCHTQPRHVADARCWRVCCWGDTASCWR